MRDAELLPAVFAKRQFPQNRGFDSAVSALGATPAIAASCQARLIKLANH